jgi:hypothetical protein
MNLIIKTSLHTKGLITEKYESKIELSGNVQIKHGKFVHENFQGLLSTGY